ncbi:hypothetical protein RJ639_032052 [Escallonia herrerae]|uniref:Myb-like domain-containing protein n=1 Tax=Escallonia herrerae TaxID=1293975 RepID=A0AA89BCZ4_9ASTE|nr:hypothetical protein RJ639_032052 [Escallonia herrerae]
MADSCTSQTFCDLPKFPAVSGSGQVGFGMSSVKSLHWCRMERTIANVIRSFYEFLVALAEVSSVEWKFINMTEQEEDLVYRMHKLVGDRWSLIAGRIPGRKAEEIERFWLMRHGEGIAKHLPEETVMC